MKPVCGIFLHSMGREEGSYNFSKEACTKSQASNICYQILKSKEILSSFFLFKSSTTKR